MNLRNQEIYTSDEEDDTTDSVLNKEIYSILLYIKFPQAPNAELLSKSKEAIRNEIIKNDPTPRGKKKAARTEYNIELEFEFLGDDDKNDDDDDDKPVPGSKEERDKIAQINNYGMIKDTTLIKRIDKHMRLQDKTELEKAELASLEVPKFEEKYLKKCDWRAIPIQDQSFSHEPDESDILRLKKDVFYISIGLNPSKPISHKWTDLNEKIKKKVKSEESLVNVMSELHLSNTVCAREDLLRLVNYLDEPGGEHLVDVRTQQERKTNLEDFFKHPSKYPQPKELLYYKFDEIEEFNLIQFYKESNKEEADSDDDEYEVDENNNFLFYRSQDERGSDVLIILPPLAITQFLIHNAQPENIEVAKTIEDYLEDQFFNHNFAYREAYREYHKKMEKEKKKKKKEAQSNS